MVVDFGVGELGVLTRSCCCCCCSEVVSAVDAVDLSSSFVAASAAAASLALAEVDFEESFFLLARVALRRGGMVYWLWLYS